MSSPAVNLKEAIRHLDSLPAMPVIAQKLLTLNLETDEGERTMLKLVEQDPQIAAKVIGLANSPLFGSSKRVTSVSDAAILLGLTRVKAVTMGIAVMSSLAKKPAGKLDLQGLWLHSLSVSLALRVLARAMPRNTTPLDDEIFLGGLLHDIGFMVLDHLDRRRSDELHSLLASDTSRTADEIENELLEMNHSQLGAELARYWDLPNSIVAVIRYHHTPDEEHAAVGQPLVSMVSLAEKLLAANDMAEGSAAALDEEEWRALGIDPARADEIIVEIRGQVEQAKQVASNF